MRSILLKFLAAVVIVVLLAAAYITWSLYSGGSDNPITATSGLDPTLVAPDAQTIPSVKLPKPASWPDGTGPIPAKGLEVSRFAEGLDHPRTMLTLPNGDVLVAETNAPAASNPGGLVGHFMGWMMNRVGAGVPSPDKIVLLRDSNGDGKADQKFDFRSADMHSPSGMAYGNGTLYIANHNAVLAFAFQPGATKLTGTPRKLMDLQPAGNHWMRSLELSPDGKDLYVGVGSATNIADNGMTEEEGRADIWEIDTATGKHRIYGAGMRNPNAMDFEPRTGELWVVVQERDMLGPDLVPDYLTDVPVGATYGWPWVYWKNHFDDRVNWNMPIGMTSYTRMPQYAMGAHTAVIGMVFAHGGERMGGNFAHGAFVARHGSWNRRPAVGYDVVFVPFDDKGNPMKGDPVPVLTGFLNQEKDTASGRPTWLAWSKTGALLVSDDTGGVIWRVDAPGAAPSPAIKPIVLTEHMKPQTELKDPSELTPEALMKALSGN